MNSLMLHCMRNGGAEQRGRLLVALPNNDKGLGFVARYGRRAGRKRCEGPHPKGLDWEALKEVRRG
jgi:hypothetical protein